MGIDWDQLFGDAKAKVNEGLQAFEQTGVPAIKASLAQWGSDVLAKQAKESQLEVNKGVKNLAEGPSIQGGFVDQLKQTLTTSGLQNYGGLIIAGVVGLLVVGAMLRGK